MNARRLSGASATGELAGIFRRLRLDLLMGLDASLRTKRVMGGNLDMILMKSARS